MVRTISPRFKSCATCRTRRVKCDRRDPKCRRCEEDGWPCPGFSMLEEENSKSHLFVRFAQASPRQKLQLQSRDLEETETDPSTPASSGRQSPSRICRPLDVHSASIARQLITHLRQTTSPGMHIQNIGTFLQFVPSRLGYNIALDDAVQCICSAYSSIVNPSPAGSSTSRSEYQKALKSLRLTLLDPKEALSSNTLCASILLSWYEILADNLDEGWLHHMNGCARLIQLRGPSRHFSDFGKALLYSQEGYIASNSLTRHQPCFLDSVAWYEILQSVRRSDTSKPVTTQGTRFKNLFCDLNDMVPRLTTLLTELYNLVASSEILQGDLTSIRALFQQLSHLRDYQKAVLDSQPPLPISILEQTPIVYAKYGLALVHVDAALLRLKECARSHMPHQNLTYECLDSNDLEQEAKDVFAGVRRNLEVSLRITPFSARKMMFMCKVMCVEVRKKQPIRHAYWDWLEELVDSTNGPLSFAT